MSAIRHRLEGDIDKSATKVLFDSMETIIFKVPNGTKAKLKRINPNISELLRDQIEKLTDSENAVSVNRKLEEFIGIFKGGPRNLSTTKDYVKYYVKKN